MTPDDAPNQMAHVRLFGSVKSSQVKTLWERHAAKALQHHVGKSRHVAVPVRASGRGRVYDATTCGVCLELAKGGARGVTARSGALCRLARLAARARGGVGLKVGYAKRVERSNRGL